MANLSKEEKTIQTAKLIASWRGITRKNVSLDARTYSMFFPHVPIIHTVHDQSGDPVFIIVDKEEATRLAKIEYNLKTKEDIPHLLPERETS